jgi:hypothetical protein
MTEPRRVWGGIGVHFLMRRLLPPAANRVNIRGGLQLRSALESPTGRKGGSARERTAVVGKRPLAVTNRSMRAAREPENILEERSEGRAKSMRQQGKVRQMSRHC